MKLPWRRERAYFDPSFGVTYGSDSSFTLTSVRLARLPTRRPWWAFWRREGA